MLPTTPTTPGSLYSVLGIAALWLPRYWDSHCCLCRKAEEGGAGLRVPPRLPRRGCRGEKDSGKVRRRPGPQSYPYHHPNGRYRLGDAAFSGECSTTKAPDQEENVTCWWSLG